MVTTTARRFSRAPGGTMLAMLPIPMVCTKAEEVLKGSRGRHSEARVTH